MLNSITANKCFLSLHLLFILLCMSCSSESIKYNFNDRIKATSLQYSNFLGDGQKKAYTDFLSGKLNPESYDKVTEWWIKQNGG